MVKKTYEDDEGFTITKNEMESASETGKDNLDNQYHKYHLDINIHISLPSIHGYFFVSFNKYFIFR